MKRSLSHYAAAVSLLVALAATVVSAFARDRSAPEPRRLVRFAVSPSGARLVLDGREVAWFAALVAMTPGTHHLRVDAPGSRCCWPLRTTVHVHSPPDGDPDSVQIIALRLPLRTAQVVLVGAPCGGVCTCPAIGLAAAAGELVHVRLPHAQWSGRCTCAAPGHRPARADIVTLHAGELNAVRWPGPPLL